MIRPEERTLSPQPPAPAAAFDPKAFAAFLESAPYGREVKPLLQFLAQNAGEPERGLALGLAARLRPHIVVDSQKAADSSRYSLTQLPADASGIRRTQIALHDGPVAVEKSGFLFGGDKDFWVPDDPEAYLGRGLPLPQMQAFSRANASGKETEGRWGSLRVYADGSRRLRRSNAQLSGALLNALLSLEAQSRGWSDAFRVGLWAGAAEFRLYRSVEKASGAKPALDRDLAALYDEWFSRPEDYIDSMAAAFCPPKREADLLRESGVAGKAAPAPANASSDADNASSCLPASSDPRPEESWLSEERLAREVP
jgi:hypothetical protein